MIAIPDLDDALIIHGLAANVMSLNRSLFFR